jgi:23S rRNA pseudouridine2605 synthase
VARAFVKKGRMTKQTPSATKDGPQLERIAKFLSRAGISSRRDAEKLVAAGRIKVNGKIIDTPATKVGPKDVIAYDDVEVGAKAPPRLWRYHKPDGLVTSHKDEKGRTTVFDSLPKELGRVISVGRLDITSEGLLLLTNDGELARHLEHPSTGFSRRYRARAYGKVTQAELSSLIGGIKIDGIMTAPIEAVLDSTSGDNSWITVTLREGKNREVRRAMEHLGLKVNRLIRVSYGPFMLGELRAGEVEEIKPKVLQTQLGHLMDFPEPVQPKTRAPKRGSHASAKRFQKDKAEPKAAPQGRGKFAKGPKTGKRRTGSAGKPGGKFQGKYAPRTHGGGGKGRGKS